jgi:predicted amidohydrolase
VKIHETKIGKIGIGLCFENLNPLYRRALTLLGEEIHCSLWVTNENMRHIITSSSIVTAIEGGVPVITSSQFLKKNYNNLTSGQFFYWGKWHN